MSSKTLWAALALLFPAVATADEHQPEFSRVGVLFGSSLYGGGERLTQTTVGANTSTADRSFDDLSGSSLTIRAIRDINTKLAWGLQASWVPTVEFDIHKEGRWELGDELQILGQIEAAFPVPTFATGRTTIALGPMLLLPGGDYQDFLSAIELPRRPRIGMTIHMGAGIRVPIRNDLHITADALLQTLAFSTLRNDTLFGVHGGSTSQTEKWSGARIWGVIGIEKAL